MKKITYDIGYYLFAVSNFLAALGGGMILGKGIDVIDNPLLHGSSILAFFVGIILGLILLQTFPKKYSSRIGQWFSIFAAFSSLFLALIFYRFAINGKLIDGSAFLFFGLLSLRFSFWFYSRVLRAAASAGQKQKIAWVEMGYFTGMIAGLVMWGILGIEFGMLTALIIDACLQFLAGCFDLYNSVNKREQTKVCTLNSTKLHTIPFNKRLAWNLALSIVFLTIGVQVIIFTLTHYVSILFASYILAAYYFGVSLAAYVCKLFNVQIGWRVNAFKQNTAIIKFNFKDKNKQFKVSINNFLTALFVGISITGVSLWQWGHATASETIFVNVNEICLLAFIIISSFFYEILALAMIDRIGYEEKVSNTQGMVMKTYGLMGIGAGISLWILSIANSSGGILIFTLIICLFLANYLCQRKFGSPINEP